MRRESLCTITHCGQVIVTMQAYQFLGGQKHLSLVLLDKRLVRECDQRHSLFPSVSGFASWAMRAPLSDRTTTYRQSMSS